MELLPCRRCEEAGEGESYYYFFSVNVLCIILLIFGSYKAAFGKSKVAFVYPN